MSNNNTFNNQINPNPNQDESVDGEGAAACDVGNKPADPMTMGRDREVPQIHQPLANNEPVDDMMLQSPKDNVGGAMPYRSVYDRHGL